MKLAGADSFMPAKMNSELVIPDKYRSGKRHGILACKNDFCN
jgi:hypothetical protein